MAEGSLVFDTRLDDKGLKSGLEKLNGLAKTTFKGIEFQAQMSRVQAISGATAIELEKFKCTGNKTRSRYCF